MRLSLALERVVGTHFLGRATLFGEVGDRELDERVVRAALLAGTVDHEIGVGERRVLDGADLGGEVVVVRPRRRAFGLRAEQRVEPGNVEAGDRVVGRVGDRPTARRWRPRVRCTRCRRRHTLAPPRP